MGRFDVHHRSNHGLFGGSALAQSAVPGDAWAGAIGIGWALSRIMYIFTYTQDAKKRGIWFGLSLIMFVIAFLWALGVVLMKLLGL